MKGKLIEELKEKYSRLYKKHPRIDLTLIEAIRDHLRNALMEDPKGLTAREISISLGTSKEKISSRLRMMIDSGDVQVSKGGKSRFFVAEESRDGTLGDTFFGREEIDVATLERFGEVIELYKKKPELLDPELTEDLIKVKNTIKSSRHNFRSHSKLVESLWTKGYTKLKKLLPRNSANRYSI